MTKAKKSVQKTVVEVHDPSSLPGKLRRIGGSKSDNWNNVIASQTIQTLWLKNSVEDEQKKQVSAAIAGLIGINPNDEPGRHDGGTTRCLPQRLDGMLSPRHDRRTD